MTNKMNKIFSNYSNDIMKISTIQLQFNNNKFNKLSKNSNYNKNINKIMKIKIYKIYKIVVTIHCIIITIMRNCKIILNKYKMTISKIIMNNNN